MLRVLIIIEKQMGCANAMTRDFCLYFLFVIGLAGILCFLVVILCITASLLFVNFWIGRCRKKGDMQGANVGYGILPVIATIDLIMILCLIGGSILFQFI